MSDLEQEEASTTPQLLRDLAHAFYWLDDALQNHMEEKAGFSLPRAQSMIMICISDGICSQSDIARHLRVTKQAVRQGVKELEAKGLVVIARDPDNGRQKIVQFTSQGEAMRTIARDGLHALEAILTERLGVSDMAALRRVLRRDWGSTPLDLDG